MISPDHHKTISYLARLAVKHNLGASELLNCIREAWEKGWSRCKRVNVSCRKKRKDQAIFLFAAGTEIAGQFPIPKSVLLLSSVNNLRYEIKELSDRRRVHIAQE